MQEKINSYIIKSKIGIKTEFGTQHDISVIKLHKNLQIKIQNFKSSSGEGSFAHKKNIEFLVFAVFETVIYKLTLENKKMWINFDNKFPQIKNILKPDFGLCRRRLKLEEGTISYTEYAIINVYIKPMTKTRKGKGLLNESAKIYKALRETAKRDRVNVVYAVVTDF